MRAYPIGLALDNYDVTGKWRYRENGAPLDTRGTMYDGRAVTTPMDLTRSLLSRPIPLARALTENLMAYAVGRRVEIGFERNPHRPELHVETIGTVEPFVPTVGQ